tara:strand:+ start:1603 stop:3108 length:1506 start_codon:yes stop_codon:yes gene_type:complete
MKDLFSSRIFYIVLLAVVILFAANLFLKINQPHDENRITTEVEVGTVRQLVSVSGIAKADQLVELGFPAVGQIEKVLVDTGDTVQEGDALVTLESGALTAEYNEALAAVTSAQASLDEVLSGPTAAARDLTAENLATALANLEETRIIENQKITNAYRTLLSSGLVARSVDPKEDATPPTISGTYNCELEGEYILEVFISSAQSGYSYHLNGLEEGTFEVFTNQSSNLGSCGLDIQFSDDRNYGRSTWTISIPNTQSSLYTTNKNAYDLVLSQAESAITLAEQAVTVAKADATNQNAPARTELVVIAQSNLNQALARLERAKAQLDDFTLTAPFAGTVTEIDILPGETVTTEPIVSVLADSQFDVTARIPEIDIGKLAIDQLVTMVFDAKDDETITGKIRFISLKATEIDGVAYYEADIELDETPAWIRSGLNADIEIEVSATENTTRIPKRFITKTDSGYEVLVSNNGRTASSTIEILLEGDDGYVAITGLNRGDTIVAP